MRKLLLLFNLAFLLTVLSANAVVAQSLLPYSINFGESQSDWVALDKSEKTGKTWTFDTKGAYSQGKYYPCVVIKMDYSSATDDYYISPMFHLVPDTEYSVEVVTCTASPANGIELSLDLGTSSTDASTFTKISEITIPDYFTNTEVQKVKFTVAEEGDYYLSLHAVAPVYNSDACLFSFSLSDGESGTIDPNDGVENVPYSVDLTSDMTGKGWLIMDNNSDGMTWTETIGFGVSMNTALWQSHNDDYISPRFRLSAGNKYKVKANIIVNGPTSDFDKIELIKGTAVDNMKSLYRFKLENPGENLQEYTFTSDSDGEYYLGFRNVSESNGSTIILYSFSIEDITGSNPEGEVVFFSDFSGSDPLNGWKVIDANDDKLTWESTEDFTGPTYNGTMAAGSADDWLITPAISLSGNIDYLVKYTISQAGAFDEDIVEVRFGTNSDMESMSEIIATEHIAMGSGTIDRVCRVSGQNEGNAYIAFRIRTVDMNGSLSLNKIEVVSSNGAEPLPVENFEAKSSWKDKTVTFSWKNPEFDTDNAPVMDGLKINIYENLENVVTLENMEAGKEEEYTYSPDNFTGNVTYKITSMIGDIESAPVEVTINLEDFQGDTIVLKNMNLDNQEAFNEWLVEDKNGGDTWTYESWSQQVIIPMMSPDNNDWLFSPEVELTADKRYVVKYDFKSSMFGASLDVTIGQTRASSAHTRILQSHEDAVHNGYVSFTTPQFSIDNDGVYSIGFHAGSVENGMAIKNVTLCYISEDKELVPVMEIPYFEDFAETAVEDGLLPDGWSNGNSTSAYAFKVYDTDEWFGVEAVSVPNALVAMGGVTGAREDWVYTPKFAFEQGKTYTVEFWLNTPEQNGRRNSLAVYTATGHDIASLGNKVLLLENKSTEGWEKHSFTYVADETSELCFAIKLYCNLSNASYVMIDDFNIAEEIIQTTAPGAPENFFGTADGNKSVRLVWYNPILDINGDNLNSSVVITTKIYEGNKLLGETTGKPDEQMSFVCTYEDESEYNGQKAYKAVSFADELEGEANTVLVEISDFTYGYLREYILISDFVNAEGWTVVDDDSDGVTWTFDEGIATSLGNDDYLISPSVNLDLQKSYYVVCELMTNADYGADLSFVYGDSKELDETGNVLASYEGFALNRYGVLRIGGVFTPESEENFFGIHVANNDGGVKIKSFKVMRMFTGNEPVDLPYFEDFEDILNIDERTNFTNKWGRRTGSANLFNIEKMPEGAPQTPSGEYAAIALEYPLYKRDETLFTPYFVLEQGKTYEVSYYLYMPGNGNSITMASVKLSPTQENVTSVELPVMQMITEPVKEWTKFTFRYKYDDVDYPYCFHFYFLAEEKNAGMIAFDDFSIKEVTGSYIDIMNRQNLWYDVNSETLSVTENTEYVEVYNAEGMMVEKVYVKGNNIDLPLNNGLYIICAYTSDGRMETVKVLK